MASRAVRLLTALTLLLGFAGKLRADSLFNFDSDVVGTSTAFSDTNNGLTATFTSSADPGGFVVRTTFFTTLTGNILANPNSTGIDNIPLTISFSNDASSISIDFATNSHLQPDLFTLTAFENSTQVGQVSLYGSVPPGAGYPEGLISFDGATFDSVVLSTTAPDFRHRQHRRRDYSDDAGAKFCSYDDLRSGYCRPVVSQANSNARGHFSKIVELARNPLTDC